MTFYVEHFALVFWPEEDSTTVVKLSAIQQPSLSQMHAGAECTVKFGGQKFNGAIAGIGKCYTCTVHFISTCIMTYQYLAF